MKYKNYGTLPNETKRNEMVLSEMVLCKMVLCEMVLCEIVLCEMINITVRSVAKQRNLICKLVANYKATLVSNRNGFNFVSRRSIFTVKGNLRFLVVLN